MKPQIAALDFETDPFLHGREVHPFACGLWTADKYYQTWGDDCVKKMIDILRCYPTKLLIYAHNGGKFDFSFLAEYLSNPVLFIQTRLVKAKLFAHEIRDSYAILPVPLSAIEKDSFDYSIMEYSERDIPSNRAKIETYLKNDCKYLYDAVSYFIQRFGRKLTIGSTALTTLKRFHSFDKMDESTDSIIRPFYYGGRVQCFESGAIKENLQCYDINSSYPFAMKTKLHPVSANCIESVNPISRVYFARIIANSRGALPVRSKTGLQFPYVKHAEFFACSHEIEAAVNLKLLEVESYIQTFNFHETSSFNLFVDACIDEKIKAELSSDKTLRLFWKLIANSAYGKFGQNPDNYKDSKLFANLETIKAENAELAEPQRWNPSTEFGTFILAERPSQNATRLNVATAASITSSARAHLLSAIASAKRPIYCDTDSLICQSATLDIHPTKLGAWKNEGSLDSIYIAGKKIYAGFLDGQCTKLACKGAKLSGEQIRDVVESNTPFIYHRDAPSIRVFHPQKFITRTIRKTV